MLTAETACKHFNIPEEDEDFEIPLGRLGLPELLEVRKKISSDLVGQEEAVEAVFNAFKLMNSGFESFCSMFFIGPTGVGKTELGRLISRHYLKDPKRLLKINCAEYSSPHEYAKLIGSPPGYVGHNEKGILSEKAELSSEWVILFDEIEKANEKLHNLLLGLLDDGSLMDSHGTELDFSRSIIIFTSNVGIKGVVGRKQMGFVSDGESNIVTYSEARETIEDAFKEEFSPEFINRIDNVVFFNELTKEDISKIVKLNLKTLPINPTKRLVEYISEGGYSVEYGARNIKRFIKQNVTLKIADLILSGETKKKFKAVFKKGELQIF